MAGTAKPVLAVVNDNPTTVAELQAALTRRSGADCEVVASADAAAVLGALGLPGGPVARRVLLIHGLDAAARMAGLRAMALGQFDDWYLLDPPAAPPPRRSRLRCCGACHRPPAGCRSHPLRRLSLVGAALLLLSLDRCRWLGATFLNCRGVPVDRAA